MKKVAIFMFLVIIILAQQMSAFAATEVYFDTMIGGEESFINNNDGNHIYNGNLDMKTVGIDHEINSIKIGAEYDFGQSKTSSESLSINSFDLSGGIRLSNNPRWDNYLVVSWFNYTTTSQATGSDIFKAQAGMIGPEINFRPFERLTIGGRVQFSWLGNQYRITGKDLNLRLTSLKLKCKYQLNDQFELMAGYRFMRFIGEDLDDLWLGNYSDDITGWTVGVTYRF